MDIFENADLAYVLYKMDLVDMYADFYEEQETALDEINTKEHN